MMNIVSNGDERKKSNLSEKEEKEAKSEKSYFSRHSIRKIEHPAIFGVRNDQCKEGKMDRILYPIRSLHESQQIGFKISDFSRDEFIFPPFTQVTYEYQ